MRCADVRWPIRAIFYRKYSYWALISSWPRIFDWTTTVCHGRKQKWYNEHAMVMFSSPMRVWWALCMDGQADRSTGKYCAACYGHEYVFSSSFSISLFVSGMLFKRRCHGAIRFSSVVAGGVSILSPLYGAVHVSLHCMYTVLSFSPNSTSHHSNLRRCQRHVILCKEIYTLYYVADIMQ